MSGVWTGWMRRLRKGEESGEPSFDGQVSASSEDNLQHTERQHDGPDLEPPGVDPLHVSPDAAEHEGSTGSFGQKSGEPAAFVANTRHDAGIEDAAAKQGHIMPDTGPSKPDTDDADHEALAFNDAEFDETEMGEFDEAAPASGSEQTAVLQTEAGEQSGSGAEAAPFVRKRRRKQPPAGKPASARQLLAQGKLPEARAAVETSIMDRRLANRIAAIDAGEHLLETLGLNAKGVSSSILQGIMLAPSTGAHQLIVVFGADNGEFALPHTLEAGRMPHILYVRDRLNCLALQGVPRLGTNYDECLVTILQIAKTLEARAIFCLGAGSAMYSALRYGLDLGASGVLAMGTLERLHPDEPVPGTRPPRYTVRMQQTAQRLGADLALAYAQAPERPGLILCRPVSTMGTVEGLAAIPRIPITRAPAAASQALLAWADQSGQLRSLVRDLLASKPVEKRRGKKKPAAPTGDTSP